MVKTFVLDFVSTASGRDYKNITRTYKLTAMSSVHNTLAVSGNLGVNIVDRGRVRRRPLCTGQIGSENARVSQTNDRKDR